ncbi:uncharacterized protein TM35_000023260 [Trypanosoma theileri]|uniref:MORN repeat-containing protein n=1 Tax=Trypanosoma theileri TaxID=67003 RepID=A0A1X0P961_9TRYP|nr:uncharacterized protein TM35_000023260 [Trypanosoma theileri]ORC93000.1 hypothetical protein TM35_000023260 [Trypanosoma theileri]
MRTITEDKIPIPLIPDTELSDVRIGATDPALFFSIALDSPCKVTIEFQEFNSASRCVLLLSPTDPRPSKHTAVWKNLSPDQNKTVTVLPADPSYKLGLLYLAVRYVEPSGNTFIRLKLTLQEQYEAEWYSLANRALYHGMWSGFSYHGRGRCIYGVPPDALEDGDLSWSGRSLRRQSEALSWQMDFTNLLDGAIVDVAKEETGWFILPLPSPTMEVYDGDWVNGKKEGTGVYQWNDKAYIGMWKGGVREGFGVMQVRDGFRYEGDWLNDKKHGKGNALYPDETQYQGDWENDVRSGMGIFSYTNGIVIRGKWKNDVLDSEVTANYPDKSRYVGQWCYDLRHGEGVYTDAVGNVFKGTWNMDKRTGKGVLIFANGVECVADWEDDVRKGGTFTFKNGEVYVGGWNDTLCVREGEGRCVYPNGDVYVGHWAADKKDGFGTLTHAEGGRCYEGEWVADRRHGIGRLEDAEGVYQGEFRDDLRCGTGLHVGRRGSLYRGEWRDDGRVGTGIGYDAKTGTIQEGVFLLGRLQSMGRARSSKDAYEGPWVDGERHGVGVTSLTNGDVIQHVWYRGKRQDGDVVYKYSNGDVYEGEWRDGLRHGKGTQHYVDGSKYSGEWNNDKPHGHGIHTDSRGEVLEGEWREGTRIDVRGRLHFVDGSVYEGDICGGKPHGNGRLSYPDGTSFEGTFRNGVYVL